MNLTAPLVALMAGIVALASVAEGAAPKITPPVAVFVKGEKRTPVLSAAVLQVVRGTNQLRTAQGRAVLGSNPDLTTAAGSFAQFMADRDLLGHEADGSDPSARATRAGYESCIVAENIAYQYLSTGFSTEELVQTLLDGWMDSPGHRANLLDADITEIGVGIARSLKSGKYYAVQLFGRPSSLKFEFTIRNATNTAVRYAIGKEFVPLPAGTAVSYMLCRPTKVVFRWPGSQSTTTIDAETAHHYVIGRAENGTYRVGTVAEF